MRNLLLILLTFLSSVFSPTLITRVEVEQLTASESQKTVREISFVHTAQAQNLIRPTKKPPLPLFSTLTNVHLMMDASRMVNSADNAFGTTSNGVTQSWKSASPGATHVFNADVVGGALGGFFGNTNTLKFQDGYIEFPGYVTLRSADLASVYNAYSYNATVANLKWTAHMVLRLGQDEVPNFFYGLFGNNATTQGAIGFSSVYTDNPAGLRSDGISSSITKGTAGFIILGTPDNLITPNVPFVLTIETDMSQAAASRQKYYINNVQFAHTVSSPSTAVVSGPTNELQIGASGNYVAPFRGWISHFILQTAIETTPVREAFVESLYPYLNKSYSNYFFTVDEAKVYTTTHTLATTGRYYFVQGLIQNPSDPNNILKIYHEGNGHLLSTDKKVNFQSSTDRGRTWSSEAIAFDPDGAGDFSIQDGEWGWSSDGMIHGLVDYHSVVVPGTHKLAYIQSTDEFGGTTVTDITSQITSDGLPDFRAHGKIIEVSGYLFATFYKGEGVGNISNYLMRKPVGSGTTWDFFQVRAPGADQWSEMTAIDLDDNNLLIVARNEDTGEFYQWRVGNITGTPSITADGPLSLNETLTVPNPPTMEKYFIGGQRVIVIYTTRKEAADRRILATYGTAANLLANGLTGWDLDTKWTVGTDTQYLHYGRVLHYNGTHNAIGAWARDPGTLTENTLITVHMPGNNYYKVKTELGITAH